MSSSLLFRQSPEYRVRLIWMVCQMGVKWLLTVLWSTAIRICSKQHVAILCSSHLAISPRDLLIFYLLVQHQFPSSFLALNFSLLGKVSIVCIWVDVYKECLLSKEDEEKRSKMKKMKDHRLSDFYLCRPWFYNNLPLGTWLNVVCFNLVNSLAVCYAPNK